MIEARYVYIKGVMEEPVEYSCVEDFLSDILTDEDIVESLNAIHEDVYVPCVGNVPAGEAIFRVLGGNDYSHSSKWDNIFEDVLQMECEYIEDELATYGELVYHGYNLVDTSYAEEE